MENLTERQMENETEATILGIWGSSWARLDFKTECHTAASTIIVQERELANGTSPKTRILPATRVGPDRANASPLSLLRPQSLLQTFTSTNPKHADTYKEKQTQTR